ncbi:MAG: hypothetical protein V5A24_09555 [Haloarculaceae archaeon]
MATSVEECIEALQDAAATLGKSPSKAQYEQLGLTPAASTILRVVGAWNEAKTEAGLETTPGRGSRIEAKPQDVELPDGKEWATLSQDQRWHYRHVDRNTRLSLERRQRHRRWLEALKRESDGCRDCDATDPVCLDYHHLDSGEKTKAINEMVLYGFSKSRISEEISKCVLLCANCHRKVHSSRNVREETVMQWDPDEKSDPPQTRAEIRRWTHLYEESLGCSDCGFVDHRCLMFHHENRSAKRDGVSALIERGCGFQAVRAEIERCRLLCANCHRRVHLSEHSEVSESDRV